MHYLPCYLLSLFLGFSISLIAQFPKNNKPILIVTTDIGQDPDDQQSLIRLLHYANEFQLAGIIANADDNYKHEAPTPRPELVHEMIDAYNEIYPNLEVVDSHYPSPNDLKKVVKKGCAGNGREIPVMDYIGVGKSTEGSQWIIKQVDEAKDIVHISIWGGACDLAQALFDLRNTRSQKEVQQFIQKIRVYFIGNQDSSNEWIREQFPNLWLILGMSHDGNSWNSSYRGIFLDGDMQLTSLEWLHKHLIGQNALGSTYPLKTYTMGGTKNPHGAMKEGDTPSFLYFLENGLNVPERPDWGGWGGRFQRIDENFFRDSEDTFLDASTDSLVTNAKATIFRWRPAIQADFAARVQWGRTGSKGANHYPIVQINEDNTKSPLRLIVEQGTKLTLDATKSIDEDGDELSFNWMIYPEASTFSEMDGVVVNNTDNTKMTISLPENGKGSIHLILSVRDHAPHPLVSYKRVIIDVKPKAEAPLVIFDTDMGSDCDDVGALAILHHYVNQGKADLLGCIFSSGKVPFGAGIIDAINTYFGKSDIPIGAEYDDSFGDPVDKMDAEKLARDTAAYGHDAIFNTDVPNHTLLNRRLLAAQVDTSVTYITVGHTKALHDLLKSEADSISELTGLELIQKKVRKWVALGGLNAYQAEGSGSKDWNFFRNETQTYTDYLLDNFPRPAYFINAGSDVLTGQKLVHAESGTIVRTAYRDWLWKTQGKILADGRPSWDLAAVCFAIEGPSTFLEAPEKGTLHFDINVGSRWEKNENGKHYYVNQAKGISSLFSKYLNSLMP